ncbi:DNA mismatch repair protein MutS [Schlesneria paludicola]|uniref:DNA mismatch repair protein MutS n=1 Tax=Schlesneria paludicola TaxID=360056 RepID=UPI00029A725B|nr:DNA mismatch repair protein MutS [Schlesneria paludicola]
MTTQSERTPTPAMQRYLEVKAQHPHAILLFRMGDFYELFYEDAVVASKAIGLTLTSRDKGSPNPIPMAGFPYHQLDGYLQRLVRAGFRAAICEQMEDPKLAKGPVKRDVTRVVTPGTLTEDSLLDPRESNFLACVFPTKDVCGLAWLEVSTGRFLMADLAAQHVVDEIARIRPAECLIPENSRELPLIQSLNQMSGMLLSDRPPWSFSLEQCKRKLLEQFQTRTLSGFDIDEDTPGVTAAGALLEYVQETQKSGLGHITRLEPYRRGSSLLIDEATRRSLELTRTLKDGQREGSLLAVIDETVTPMGARLLGEWLSNPLTDATRITLRLDAVEELTTDAVFCRDLREQLQEAYDLQRLTARVATGRCSPRDLACLARTLALLPKLKAKLSGRAARRLIELEDRLDLCPEIRADIESALVDEPPMLTSDGGMIRPGYHSQLDEWRDLARGGKDWITKYQSEEITRTGIPNLKVGFNKVFGYYLECTAAQAEKVPADYIRKQTLKNYERFITPQLKEYEEKVLRAEGQAVQLEQELFNALRERVAVQAARLRDIAEVLAEVDTLAGLSTLAVRAGYCRPQISIEPVLDIREGRHPVLDRLKPSGEFVPNDVRMGAANVPIKANGADAQAGLAASTADYPTGLMQLITGPNMAGKSTYIRQAALITIMAQMGSFVPAAAASIGIADRVFARVGASDELGKGQSTFMVEMTETARILNAATKHSLVILDEIGRGTSTYDGISLAWAITEYLHDVTNCRTMFATHYHELTQLTESLKQCTNWNVAVREDADDVIFLHKIVPGAADKSYGIHVAQLAGVPRAVLERAKIILKTLEDDHLDDSGKTKVPARRTQQKREFQLALFADEEHPIIDELRQLNVNELTPLAALQELHRLRQQVK